jgi:hypothetical protein
MRVSKDGLVDAVAALLLSSDNFKTEGRFRNAIDLSDKVSALVVKKAFAVGDQKLQVADLRRIDRRVINLGDTPVVVRIPDATGG